MLWNKNQKPYAAVGNVSDSGANYHSQIRFRIVVQYKF
ncbi:MAG: oligogalacturonate-specific porin KdgM family protein [Candidatus Malihini olakiniferum]